MTYPTKKLDEIVDFHGGLWTAKKGPIRQARVLRNTNFRYTGFIDFSDVAEIEVEERQLASRLLRSGDLLLERSGGGPTQPVGRVMYFDNKEEFSFSNFTTRMRVKDEQELNPIFLWRYLNYLYDSGFTEKLQKQTTGIRNLIFSEYKEIKIPVPPLAEQKRIVAMIEKHFATIDGAARLRAESQSLTSQLLPSALHEIFSSHKWEEKSLGEITEIVTGKTPPTSNREYYDGGILWAGPPDLENSKVTVSTRKTVTQEAVDRGVVRVIPSGSVLVSCIGIIGKAGIASQPMATNQQINAFIPDTDKVNSTFLYYAVRFFRPEFEKRASQTTLPIINKSRCAEIKIPVPALAEQKRIVKKLDALSEKVCALQALQKQQSADFKSLKQSILHQAFTS